MSAIIVRFCPCYKDLIFKLFINLHQGYLYEVNTLQVVFVCFGVFRTGNLSLRIASERQVYGGTTA